MTLPLRVKLGQQIAVLVDNSEIWVEEVTAIDSTRCTTHTGRKYRLADGSPVVPHMNHTAEAFSSLAHLHVQILDRINSRRKDNV